MMNRVAAVTYHFTLEIILGFLIIFLFYINKNQLPPIFLLGALCIGSIILFSLLLEKFHNKGKGFYFITVFPLLLVIWQQTELSLFMGLGLGLIVFWRGITLFNDVSYHSESLLLLLSFFIGLIAIIYSAMSGYPYQSEMIYLLISQLVIVLISGYFRKWNLIKKDKSKFAIYFLKIMGVITVIGVAFIILLKYIQFIFFTILQFIVFLFTRLAEPLFSILQYLFSLVGNDGRKENLIGGRGLLDKADKYQAPSYENTESIPYILLILGAVIFIFYLFYKKKLKPQTFTIDSSSVITVSEGVFGAVQSTLSRWRFKPPEDIIRREIFELEKYAQKQKLGRLPFETLGEWWKRVGLLGSNELIAIYEKVRYGGGTSLYDEQILLKREIPQLKQQLKNIRKSILEKKKNS
ncbi:hypothetical protein QNH20_08470 [Neobacillus sp. WH10]|uniref:hypothetical protein n=1 Tax=Neobacillus sp. WH10 TaxID=3047873 RepID=UPI0024C1089B|nr:hypothetical protein [Neobacillus sp. WH10]WHY79150.1 hypothetical protein QNH20_08470 [Neobacillus sp. WH10]